jgi:sugar lactone lactonase YvrE
MKRLFPLLASLALTTAVIAAPIPNYPDADLVLGQPNFTASNQPNSATATSLYLPTSLAVDPVSRKVFVADRGHNRVLRYASADLLASGAAAEMVFGQDDLTSSTPGIGANRLSYPFGIFLDTTGRLWVTDFGNFRIVMYNSASTRLTGAAADKVVGQPDFTTNTQRQTSSSTLWGAYDCCVDSLDRLWVAHYGDNRVLRFDNITTKANGAAADGVLGQTDFTTRTFGVGQSIFRAPSGVAISASGALYVTDNGNSRVLRFDNAATLADGANASAVFGQPDFTNNTSGFGAAKMRGAAGAWITADDSLWVTEQDNSRVIRFNNASTRTNGAVADAVVGQVNFTNYTATVTMKNLYSPFLKPFVDAKGALWVADTQNNRVVRYPAPADVVTPPIIVNPPVTPPVTPPVADTILPILKVAGKVPAATGKKSILIQGTASDSGGIKSVQYVIGRDPQKTATGTTAWQIKPTLKKGKNEISITATDNAGNVSAKTVIKIKRK